ncbi:hypothetical protein CEE37_13035 [candidate division LCP-89 bacterium B3_LCP]|uniref:Right handed beta helix domain-containing protein n=1 Tax=candidate division LCP-89 bacterium B3_LCP TaxID=2012998 RepID=A0A532UU05_UNCL8|nr:MAG: hypothetical protein CEE37_13035 [candidate division LCP-89 bacterium B3_LCP]
MKKVLMLTLALTFLSLTAYGATLLVPSQYTTIQAAINASSDGDTVLVASGTYTGEGNRNLDFWGRAIVVMSENGPLNTDIICDNSGRGLYFHSGETSSSEFQGFTIAGGSSAYGGGINITNASPYIHHCIIWNNSSANSYGGGVYITNGSPIIEHCTISGNSSKYGGGVYAAASNMEFNSNIVSNNTASG